MAVNSRYGADLGGRTDPNPIVFDGELPPLGANESLLGSHLALRSITNIGNTAGVLLSGGLPPTWTRYVDLTADAGDSFLKHDKFDLKYSGSAVFVPSTLPGSPVEGEFVYTSATHQFQFWNGSGWVTMGSGTVGVSSVQGTANQITASPITGDVIVSLPNQIAIVGGNAANILRFSREIATNILLPSKTPAFQIVGSDGTGVGSALNNPPNVALVSPNVGASADQNQSDAKLELIASRSTIAQLNAGTFTAVTTSDMLGEIRFGGDDTVNIRAHGARIRAAASATWTASSHPADLYLATVPVGSTGNAVDRWVVQSGGHLIAATDNAFDIGISNGSRPRHLYLYDGVDVLNSVDAPFKGYAYTNTAASGATLLGHRARVGPAAVVTDDNLTGIYGAGYHSGAAFSGFVAAVRLLAEEGFTSGAQGTRIEFATTTSGTTSRTARWRISNAGHFLTESDNTYDIGANAATRPRTGYFGTSIVVGGSGSFGTTLLVSGDLTVGARLLFTTAASKIVPGATSLALRNNADSADNLILTDAGDATLRTKLTMPGPLLLTTAASKIIPGATSLALRNNADSADNLLLTDAGAATFRNTITTSAGDVVASGMLHGRSAGTTGVAFRVGDDLTINDANIANTAQLQGFSAATQAFLNFGSGNGHRVGFDGTNAIYDTTGFHSFQDDLQILTLGKFDSTGTRFSSGTGPVADDVMSYHGAAGKWRPRFLQTAFTSGAAVSQNNTDGTFATYYNSAPALSGTPTAPGAAPVVTPLYKAMLIDMSAYVLGATQVYVLDYSINGGAYTSGKIISTSAKVIHSSLDPTKTYAYKFLVRGGTDSVYSSASAAQNPATTTEANAFGLIVASQIATAYLSAINANIGSITAGQLLSGDGKSLLQLDATFSVPSAVTQGIFFASANPVPGTVTGMYIDFTATSTRPLFHHAGLDLLANGSATFSGTVASTSFTGATAFFYNNLQIGVSGVFSGRILEMTATQIQFDDTVGGKNLRFYSNTAGQLNLDTQLTNGRFYIGTDANKMPVLVGDELYSPVTGEYFHVKGAASFSPVAGAAQAALLITGATETSSIPIFDATQTWNNAGVTFTGLRFNATSTLSAAGSLLFDLQLAASSKFSVRKDGRTTLQDALVFGAAASKIIPGATSLSHRNNADNADNILIADAGGITFRAGLSGITTIGLSGAMSGGTTISMSSFIEQTEESAPSTPAANKTRDYAKDASGVSKRYYLDDAGVEHPHNLTLIDTQTFTATGAGTWTKPAGTILVLVECIGAGGGGGGGFANSTGTLRGGGAGGGAGARTREWWQAADLGATEATAVGTGGTAGTGGAGPTAGGAGGLTSFGTTIFQWAYGGGGGASGTGGGTPNSGGSGGGAMSVGVTGGAAAVNGGAPAPPLFSNGTIASDGQGFGGASAGVDDHGHPAAWGGASGGAGDTHAGPGNGGVGLRSGGGGGGGGRATVANGQTDGGPGGGVGSGTSGSGGAAGTGTGGAGGAGSAGSAKFSGQGGGGGSGSGSGTGGVGGAGGAPGGAGGGGGAGTGGGNGGAGGRGEVRVYSYA